MTACPVGAISISPVGAKDVIDDQCVGCKLCTIACPYGTMFYNPDTQKAFKCNLCGGAPACADAVPDRRRSPTRTSRRRTGSATSRPSARGLDGRSRPEAGPLMPARHVIVGGGTAGLNAIRTIREKSGRAAGRLRDHPGLGRAPVLAHGAAVLPRAHHRRVATSTPPRRPRWPAWKVKAHLGRRATALDPAARTPDPRRRRRRSSTTTA